jgi:hypothetical protein
MDLDKARTQFFRHLEKQRSGLDILSDFSKRPPDFSFKRAEEFAERARAGAPTWDLYRGAQALRAWEFLALFHELDPGVLALNRRGRLAYIETMGRAAGRNGQVLEQFRIHVYGLRRSLVEQMPERLRPDHDPVQTVVELAWFRKWAHEHRLMPHPQAQSTDTPDTVTLTEPTRLMRNFARAAEEVREKIKRGGPKHPSRPGKLGWVRQAFRDAGLSENLARAAATMVARPHQGAGRPGKT